MKRSDLFLFAAVSTMVALLTDSHAAWSAGASFTGVYLLWLTLDVLKAGWTAYIVLRTAEKVKREREQREREKSNR